MESGLSIISVWDGEDDIKGAKCEQVDCSWVVATMD